MSTDEDKNSDVYTSTNLLLLETMQWLPDEGWWDLFSVLRTEIQIQ